MTQFKRRLDRFELLRKNTQKPQWWNDFLSLWRPSGHNAGNYGLRLAIRNNTLNFYRRGQSIGRVEIGAVGMPTATVHIKYVEKTDAGALGQEYVTLRQEWLLRKGERPRRYAGIEALKQWIETVDGNPDGARQDGYTGIEKVFVDNVVAANLNIIDLEMGLPAWGQESSVPRMDIVELEASAASRRIVFWEAKRISDSRLRCSTMAIPDVKLEVLKQLAAYRRFLTQEASHAELVIEAYRHTA